MELTYFTTWNFGLNVAPKTTCLATYSHSISPRMNERFRAAWLEALRTEKLLAGKSFNLDFHSIPFFGEDEFVERHYLSKRSRSQKSILAFLAQDADSQVVCYSHADLLKRDQADEVLRFAEFWRNTYGSLPAELVFDSKLTTFARLNDLNQMGITFMTLRRRSPGLLREMANLPRSAWQTIRLEAPRCSPATCALQPPSGWNATRDACRSKITWLMRWTSFIWMR